LLGRPEKKILLVHEGRSASWRRTNCWPGLHPCSPGGRGRSWQSTPSSISPMAAFSGRCGW